jgi:hypothetical protein
VVIPTTKLREEREHFGQDVNEVVYEALLYWLEEHMVPAMAEVDFEKQHCRED